MTHVLSCPFLCFNHSLVQHCGSWWRTVRLWSWDEVLWWRGLPYYVDLQLCYLSYDLPVSNVPHSAQTQEMEIGFRTWQFGSWQIHRGFISDSRGCCRCISYRSSWRKSRAGRFAIARFLLCKRSISTAFNLGELHRFITPSDLWLFSAQAALASRHKDGAIVRGFYFGCRWGKGFQTWTQHIFCLVTSFCRVRGQLAHCLWIFKVTCTQSVFWGCLVGRSATIMRLILQKVSLSLVCLFICSVLFIWSDFLNGVQTCPGSFALKGGVQTSVSDVLSSMWGLQPQI